VNFELFCQLGSGFFVSKGGKRYLGLELDTVLTAFFTHDLILQC
jgi:hypothetical protein